MILSDISAKVTSMTGASTSVYTNAERLIDLNIWQQNVVTEILDAQDESDFDDPNHGNFPRKTVPLTTNRDYSIPISEKMLKVKSVSIAYNGTTFYRASPLEYSANQLADATSTATT